MDAELRTFVITGYCILPFQGPGTYRGIDRGPFEPVLLDNETQDPPPGSPASAIWAYYPEGWRRAAFKLFEEHALSHEDEPLCLLDSASVAETIRAMIPPEQGQHEVLRVTIAPIPASSTTLGSTDGTELGYDIAYLGG